jgi:HEAT repeat protein
LVVDFLHAKQPDIRAEAAITLGHMGVNDTESIQRLTDALHDGEEGVRAAAAAALGTLRPQAPLAVPLLADALADRSPRVVRQVAHALCQFGGDAREATHGLFQALRAALVACDDVTADCLATALHAITPDPLSQLHAYVDEHDEDLFHVASQLLQPPEE